MSTQMLNVTVELSSVNKISNCKGRLPNWNRICKRTCKFVPVKSAGKYIRQDANFQGMRVHCTPGRFPAKGNRNKENNLSPRCHAHVPVKFRILNFAHSISVAIQSQKYDARASPTFVAADFRLNNSAILRFIKLKLCMGMQFWTSNPKAKSENYNISFTFWCQIMYVPLFATLCHARHFCHKRPNIGLKHA